ncbi:TonB-dependent receptor [Euzebyella marina]|uniref:TonB-dependent receptor n=1 Tax=Euzebyella marina TaxID=1761453 RepID=A0A3G2L7Y7_9FLAO|nr:TonB-dependent receptor [Euzebyella marina]AYN68374.1 TonB-dependent receptor [Euzebyella marina]
MFVNTILRVFLVSLSSLSVLAQSSVTGHVLDAETKEPLMGVSVMIKNTDQGTTTDFDGDFIFSDVESYPLTLIISYIGFASQEVNVLKNGSPIIHLVPTAVSLNEITVTARRRSEEVQDIPISVAVIGAKELDNSASFNVNHVKELVPSVQLYSSNPRNTTLNIRGIGTTFGLTNDGIDPGVGFYVDGVYYARPAATTLDFIDVQQIEVIRGMQGTLFGKNTTAGTFNITSRKPSFQNTAILEQSFGNYGFIQTKGSFSGPLIKDVLAARLSFTSTDRDGTLYNVVSAEDVNTLDNKGFRGQLLYLPTDNISLTLAADYSWQRPNGYAQVYVGSVRTQRDDFRQFENIAGDLNYSLPSTKPFDRLIDTNTPWVSNQDMGGISLKGEMKVGEGTLTSTSAWRSWKWDPSSDRDFTGLDDINKSQAPSIHHQWSQEVRYSGKISKKLNGTIGIFTFYQKLDPDKAHIQVAGKDTWRFVQNTQDTLWRTPNLLEGLTQDDRPRFNNFSGALFGQIDYHITDKFIVTPGIRLNYDQKEVHFVRTVYGGLDTDNPDLLALKNRVFSPLTFQANVDDWNLSGQLDLRYVFHENLMAYTKYSYGFKPVGLNLGGIPTENGEPVLSLAVVEPERVSHFEAGLKTRPVPNGTLNFTAFNTDIFDYQTTVRSAEIGVIRGYLANAEQVRTRGLELETNYALPYLTFFTSVSYTEGNYIKFDNAPVPLEETGIGGNELKDISGEVLPGISKWSFSSGVEGSAQAKIWRKQGEFFLGTDVFYRSGFSSNPTPSKYLNIDGYSLVNGRLGFRTTKGVTVYVWSRNLLNTNYFEQLLVAGGNTGQYGGVLGDPRTFGLTIRYNYF